MSNNKKSSVEWYSVKRDVLEIEVRLGKISSTQYDEQLIKIEEQSKEKHRKEIIESRQNGLDNGFSNGNWDSNLYYQMEFGGENE
jgi:hypothetical protein